MHNGTRVDIALAVCLEVAGLQLVRAQSEMELWREQRFNQNLWRTIAALAPQAPYASDRADLDGMASLILGGAMTPHEQSALNCRVAHQLAGRAATAGALGSILVEWRSVKRESNRCDFGVWLLERLQSMVQNPLTRAA